MRPVKSMTRCHVLLICARSPTAPWRSSRSAVGRFRPLQCGVPRSGSSSRVVPEGGSVVPLECPTLLCHYRSSTVVLPSWALLCHGCPTGTPGTTFNTPVTGVALSGPTPTTIPPIGAATLAAEVANDVADDVAGEVADEAGCHAPACIRSESHATSSGRTPTLDWGHARLCACAPAITPSHPPEAIYDV
jgi:hypothetical protein